jgi:FKBP-type peptidyl-prolyl cis-trans isomerase
LALMNVPGSVIKAWDEGIAQLSLGGTRFLPLQRIFFIF